MRIVLAASAAALAFAASGALRAEPQQAPGRPDWRLVVLGIAQDGGIPHLRCTEGVCAAVRDGRRAPAKVSSIGVVNRQDGGAYVFDATPDFRAQVHRLTRGSTPDGIFLTHAHVGHYTGLMYLGRESIGAQAVPVWGTARMTSFLRNNGPWSLLVRHRNIDLRIVEPGRPVVINGELRVTAFTVPHRDELTDTVGYRIEGPRASALFVPDTDRWETWTTSIREMADTVDLALVDGTFASAAEVKGRDIWEIPHPMMGITRSLLRGVRARVRFIHINHTNTEIDAPDVAREGWEFPL